MPKPYSQDLRDRVIDAVERGAMSRRAAVRRYEISKSVAIKWLERLERDDSESRSAMEGIALPSSCRIGNFWKPRGPRNRTSGFRRSAIAFGPSAAGVRHFDDEPLFSAERRDV